MKVSYIYNKIKDNIRKYGFFIFIKRAAIKISHITLEKADNTINSKRYSVELKNILEESKYKKVIVFYPFFDFNMPNFQRFQQLALAIGEQDDIIFFYCTPNNIHDNIHGFKKERKNLYITNQYELLIKSQINNRIMYFVSTDVKSSLNDIKESEKRGDKIIYDYVDEIHSDIIGKFSDKLIQKHKYIMNNKNIITLVTAQNLLNDVEKYRKNNVYLVTNGVRIEDFQIIDDNYSSDRMNKLKNFKKNKKVTICYYGALASWFDYELIKYIAEDETIGIILIGIDYDKSMEKSGLKKLENVLYLGSIEYKKLKYYANEADIMIIPFIVNEITNATSPVKLFEYMALQKPIITTDMKECRKYKSVSIAKDYKEFKEKIYNIKNEIDKDLIDKDILLREAYENSWKSKAISIINII